jgi:excinuclease ABC subunit C
LCGFDSQGAKKRDYRHYLIKDIIGGDDYAAMEQALRRRFSKVRC